MTPKEMLERLNVLTNKMSDLEQQIKDAARESKRILSLLEELPSELDEIVFTENTQEEEPIHTEDFEPDAENK